MFRDFFVFPFFIFCFWLILFREAGIRTIIALIRIFLPSSDNSIGGLVSQ